MGYKFSLVLSREITEDEKTTLQEAGCAGAADFGTDSLPTNAEVTVTKMDFDDTVSPTLADAIESALEAVQKVPDLSASELSVPAQPAGPPEAGPGVVAGTVISDEGTSAGETATVAEAEADEPAAKETSAKKPRTARKPRTVKDAASQAKQSADTAGSPD